MNDIELDEDTKCDFCGTSSNVTNYPEDETTLLSAMNVCRDCLGTMLAVLEELTKTNVNDK